MSREISLFTDYHQGENTVTNYCGLMMKLIYEESPKSFEDFMSSIVGLSKNILIGPTFNQQVKKTSSIPDLVISQQSFSVFFETKLNNWHYEAQVKRHLNSINDNVDKKVLILLADEFIGGKKFNFQNELKKAEQDNIILKTLSFEELIGYMKIVCNSENLIRFLNEFEIFLDNKKLLPKWKYLLDVVNCAGSMQEIQNFHAYICPKIGSSYSHRRAKFFGPYSSKKVEEIYEIKGVVITDKNIKDYSVKWKDNGIDEKDLIKDAETIIKQCRPNEYKSSSFQVFLLENGAPTNFIKDSPGGLYQSKKYFWEIAEDCRLSSELAAKLKDKNWSDFE